MKISNRSRKSFLSPDFVRAWASPIKTGERGKLESFEGMVKKAKLWRLFFWPFKFHLLVQWFSSLLGLLELEPTEWFKQSVLIHHSCCVLPVSYWNTLSQCNCGEQNRWSKFGGSIWLKQWMWTLGLAVSNVQLQEGWRLRQKVLFYGMLHAKVCYLERLWSWVSNWVSTSIHGIQAPRANLEYPVAKE